MPRGPANENPHSRRTWCADVAVSVAVSRFGFTPQIVHNQRNTNFIVWSLVGHLTMIFCKCKFHWGRLGYFQRVNLFFAPTLKGRDRPVYMDYWHCLHSMRSRVYESVTRPSVLQSLCPSVSSQHLPQQQSLLLWLGQKEILSIDCCTAYSSAACGERMRAVPRCQLTS